MTERILFVCLGNICRSPAAEGVVRAMAAARGLAVELDSAGTGDWHVGEPPYAAMTACAKARGYDLAAQRARQVTAADFDRFDRILAMDASTLERLQALAPDAAAAGRLAHYTSALGPEAGDVPDPYYTRGFDETLDLVERGAEALLDALERPRKD